MNKSLEKKYERHYFRNSLSLPIHPIGLTTSRFQSVLYFDGILVLPISCSLGFWDVKTQQRVHLIQFNTNSVYSVHSNDKYIYSVAYNGEIAIIDKQKFELIRMVNDFQGHQVRYSFLSDKYMTITSELTNLPSAQRGVVTVYDLNGNFNSNLKGRFLFGSTCKGNLIVVHEAKVQIPGKENLTQHERQKLSNNQQYIYTVQQYCIEEMEQISSLVIEKQGRITCASAKDIGLKDQSVIGEIIAYLFEDRSLYIYDCNSNSMIYNGSIDGKGVILSCSFFGNDLIFSKNRNLLTKINCEDKCKLQQVPQVIQEQVIPNVITHIKFKEGLQSVVQFMKYFLETDLIIVNEDGTYIFNHDQCIFKQTFGGITFCGIALSSDNKHVVVGDFVGGVHIFDINQIQLGEKYSTNVGIPIRSLAHLEDLPLILFGTVNGFIYLWNYNSEPELLITLDGSITIIRTYKIDKNQNYVLVSTTEGRFHLFLLTEENELIALTIYDAHKPQINFDKHKFGSLDVRAEMWSTCFHPKDPNIIATCSEDQKVHVYSRILDCSPILEKVLEGHEFAVTSVDWTEMEQGIVLASCSDDQTIRFYDENLQLIDQASTSWIKEWHTLTYMALQKHGNIAAIAAQNGYLFLYSLKEKKFLYAEKVHMGGIEGLIWKDHFICTCSSDNITNIIDMSQIKR